jgi:hypothetical protein
MRRLLLVVLLALAVSPALAKSLDWRTLDVTARLDKDGALHVTERHGMVFDGDWNGGERTFRIGAGQGLHFESITRIDEGVEELARACAMRFSVCSSNETGGGSGAR